MPGHLRSPGTPGGACIMKWRFLIISFTSNTHLNVVRVHSRRRANRAIGSAVNKAFAVSHVCCGATFARRTVYPPLYAGRALASCPQAVGVGRRRKPYQFRKPTLIKISNKKTGGRGNVLHPSCKTSNSADATVPLGPRMCVCVCSASSF